MEFLNNPEPWWGAARGPLLGIVDLIQNGTVPAEAAAALWWSIERGASFFVVAQPGSAGKTTLANALLSFLPKDARLYAIDGAQDRIDVPPPAPPVYLLVNELSNHMQRYVHGASAVRAFALLREGHRIVGTLHADSAAEALTVMQDEAGIGAADAARIPLILVLRPGDPASVVGWRLAPDAERRLVQIGRVVPEGNGARMLDVAAWEAAGGRLVTCPEPGGLAALADLAGVAPETARQAISKRRAVLADLVARGARAPEAISASVQGCRHDESAV